MIIVEEFQEGRVLSADNETDRKLLLRFTRAIQIFSARQTNLNKRRLKQNWIRVEHAMGKPLYRMSGLWRDEIFDDES